MNAGQTYTFDYRGATGGVVDPYLALFGPGFTYITEDDDGGAGRGSMITYTPTTTGTYYLYATSFYTVDSDDPSIDTGAYTINMWSPEADVPGSTNVAASIATAVEITVGTTFGNLEVEGDNDYFAIDVSAGMVYTFGYAGGVWGAADRDGEAGENLATLVLYNAAGTQLSSNFNYESGTSYFAATDTTIYVRVAGSNEPNLGGTGGYTLDVTEIDPSTRDPLQAFNWDRADNIDTVDEGGVQVAYVYFAPAGENFGEKEPNGVTPMNTQGWLPHQIDAVMSALGEYTPITGIEYRDHDGCEPGRVPHAHHVHPDRHPWCVWCAILPAGPGIRHSTGHRHVQPEQWRVWVGPEQPASRRLLLWRDPARIRPCPRRRASA